MNYIFNYLTYLPGRINISTSGLISACFLLLLSSPYSHAEDNHAFLITGSSSEITFVSQHDLRRIYLGGSAINTPDIANPVINKADPETYKLFLKNVMHMNEGSYKRKVIKRVFRQGSDKIIEISNLSKLDQHFKNNPNDICYISDKDSKHLINIKIIRELW